MSKEPQPSVMDDAIHEKSFGEMLHHTYLVFIYLLLVIFRVHAHNCTMI